MDVIGGDRRWHIAHLRKCHKRRRAVANPDANGSRPPSLCVVYIGTYRNASPV